MSDTLFIEDGYTLTKTIDAVPGFHPLLLVVYRPALHAERKAYLAKYAAMQAAPTPKGGEQFAGTDVDAVMKYVVSINGEPLPKDKERVARLHTIVIDNLTNLIFSYTPADEAKSGGN